MMSRLRLVSILLAGLVLAGGSTALALSAGGSAPPRVSSALARAAAISAPTASGSDAEFRFLARQTSNRCSLQRSALEAMPDRMRLQGSCCFPMDLAAYRVQVHGLRRYVRIPQIPRDPYDVSVSLAKRLLAYEGAIHLSPAQQGTYARAMRSSDTKGPCCCHCWRWDAFRGLSDYLIAQRGWPAERLARVIDLVEGCGGSLHS